MKCKNCGRKVKDDFEFCPSCGAKIVRELVCPSCGATNEADSLFCKKCGTRLTEQNQGIDSSVERVESNKEKKLNSFHILSIIGMSLPILCMVLLFSFLFIPCLSDSFMPTGDYTIISYITRGLSPTVTEVYPRILAIVVLCIFIIVSVSSLVILGIGIFKFVKALINKKYYNLSKLLGLHFALFFFQFVLFVRFIISSDVQYVDSISGWVIFLIVLVGLTLMFNLFLSQNSEGSLKINRTILVESIFLVLFTSLCLISLFIGGNKFGLSITSKDSASKAIVGPVGFIQQLLKYQHTMTQFTIPFVTKTGVFLGLSFLFELAAFVLLLLFIAKILFSKRDKFVMSIILSSLITLLLIASTIFDSIAASTIAQLNMIPGYGVSITCSHIIGDSLAKIILSGVLCGPLCAVWAMLMKRGDKVNE